MANIGIDLGTTHSLVAVVLDGKARCLLDDAGEALLPSAVRYTPEGPVVGREALAGAAEHAGTTITSVKRLMGRSLAEARSEADQLTYDLAEGEDRVVRIQVGDRRVTPIEVSAEILRALAGRARDCLLGEPGGAVITVPAWFDDAQRQATRDAGRLAGLEVLRLLNEPTAAAVAYGLQNRSKGTFAVYDLGGGTFDISILELTDGVFQVLSTAGDTHLGGDDLDRALAARLLAEAGLSGAGGGVLRQAIEAAEAAKKALSASEATTIDTGIGGRRVRLDLDRGAFEEMVRPILARTLRSCERALADAGLTPEAIDGVVLVGGSTRVPLVRRLVADFFRADPLCDIDPDQVVALGAAMQADILGGSSELADDLLLLDIIPLSLGLETMGGVVERLLVRGTPIPATASETFTTHAENQSAMDLHVVQGEREMAADCRSLARFKLKGLPALPAGMPRVEVTFTVDADGILTVSATERFTGAHAEVEVQPSYGLTDDEIERMLEESLEHAEEDVDARLLIEARIEAEQVLRALDRAMEEDAELLHEGEAVRLRELAERLREAVAGADRKRIAVLTRELDEVSAPFAQRRIERDLQKALAGRDALEVAEELDVGGE